jgi:hypothetical protein
MVSGDPTGQRLVGKPDDQHRHQALTPGTDTREAVAGGNGEIEGRQK